MNPLRVGLLGCGNISGQYIETARMHPEIEVVACADLNRDAADAQARAYGIGKVADPSALVRDPDVDLVVNLTPPAVHADVTLEAIEHGKHVFTEKPLAPSLDLADAVRKAAASAGVQVGGAPATFLGGGLQTCRKLIDDGWIGTPVAGTAFFTNRGYEHWHPNVDPFYGFGGGPMLDLGPYLISTLISFFGPVRRVSASTHRFSETRPRPGHQPGENEIPVGVTTHAAGTVDFASGPIITVVTSWEMWAARLPYLEVYGTGGTLSAPNTDVFDGNPVLRRPDARDLSFEPYPPGGGPWLEIPLSHRGDVGRAIGVADMADAIRNGRPIRAGLDLAYHTLEVMLAFDESSQTGQHVEIRSTCDRPEPLPALGPGDAIRFS